MGSLFDGIGGFPLAATHAGIEPIWASEIEPFPIEVTRLHFPNMLHVGDITKLNGALLPPVDIICGGSPCQDLSVAGARAGLSGERSGLFMEQIRIVKEMRNADKLRGRAGIAVRPRYCVWENVPGAFSSAEGKDFQAVLREFVQIEEPQMDVVRPPAGRWEYAGAVLGVRSCVAWVTWDAQYFGVPQRRKESSLSRILQATAPYRYYLTRIACLGILRRAEERGKALPKMLETALMIQAGFKKLYHYNKRFAQQAAGFLAESSATAHTVGFEEGLAPTMKAGGKSGAVMLPTYCLNDQGGQRMDFAEDQSGTLRAQSHGHEPLVFGNHGIDARYTGPHEVSPTMSARYGTGGNNTPLVARETAWCITGNAIDREPQNGGNGLGIDENIAFTLTATDHHAVFSRQRTDLFKPDEIASTESARQYKDATDLVLEAGESLEALLIRRLMPVECERLQGYPDGWTELPGASDSARYKALGNSVAIPCVDRLMLGIATAYHKELRYELPQ